MHNLSDEALCDRWVENPYFQYFCGEVVFRHELPFDRSSLTRWRQRLGEEQIAALLQESLSVAHRTGAIETKDLERVVVDTTVQEKAIAHPTDARLIHRAIEKLVDLAKREGVELRQSYLRVAKRAAIMVGRYTHAHQFKRARRELKFLRTRLGRIIRDIDARSRATLRLRIALVRCSISPTGFAIKSSVSAVPRSTRCTPPRWSASAKARPGHLTSLAAKSRLPRLPPRPKAGSSCCMPRPCTAIPMTATRSVPSSPISKSSQVSQSRRIHGDKGYRGHNYPDRFKVWISGQVRRVTKAIRREMRRRAAVEPVIGHLKDDHRMRRNHLKGRDGDRINAVLAAAGYNFSLLRRWFAELLRVLLWILCRRLSQPHLA